MRHAILGAGGVGGLLGGALARAGHEILLIMRPPSLQAHPGRLRVGSQLLGRFEVAAPAVERLDRPVEVLWVTVKATQLEAALPLAPPAAIAEAVVIPLLNGIDHVTRLRDVYGGRVLPAAFRGEAEKTGPGEIVQIGTSVAIELAPAPELSARAEAIARDLEVAGLPARVREGGEGLVLWSKLAMLAPLALGTSALGRPFGEVRADAALMELVLASSTEVCAVAAAEGVRIDPEPIRKALVAMPDGVRSSMQKDLEAGRPPELDAIGGPILRRGQALGIATPATEELVRRVRDR